MRWTAYLAGFVLGTLFGAVAFTVLSDLAWLHTFRARVEFTDRLVDQQSRVLP